MYVYGIIANVEDYWGTTHVLVGIKSSEQLALKGLKEEQKSFCDDTKLEIKRFRVDKKENCYIVVSEYEDAGAYFNDFLHLTTSEKKANGWKKNAENRKMHYNLKVLKYIVEKE